MPFKVKYIFILLVFSGLNSSFAQKLITGKIVDAVNGTPLPFVTISLDNKSISYADAKGNFSLDQAGEYQFELLGYEGKKMLLESGEYYVIQLDLDPSQLDEVLVSSSQIPERLKKATASVAIISETDIQRSNILNFDKTLNRVPGIFMQSGALNTNRITIRGIGARTPFGTSKIRAYFKDIPLTNGSGETNIEDFELGSIARFEIVKGAASSIYGAGLGGVIRLEPENAILNRSDVQTEFTVGSFGLLKSMTKANVGFKNSALKAIYSHTSSDGYRENNNYDRQTFTLSSDNYLNKSNQLTFFGSFVHLKAFIPSSVNEDTYLNHPEAAAFTWKQAKGYEDADRLIAGLSWSHDYNPNLKQLTSVFTSLRKSYEPRPFNILKENTSAFGLRSRLLGQSKSFKWTLGGELFHDCYNYATFENLYEDYPPGTGSVQGNELSDFREHRYYYNAFAEVNFEASKDWTISMGMNLNQIAYTLKDRFPISTENPDQSGNYTYKTILSPKLGTSYLINDNISIFSSVSHGFSPISSGETLLPDGQINTNLKPETGWNYEVGSRGAFLENRLQYSISLFRLALKNLLVAQRTAQDQYIGLNAGKTRHDGLELGLSYQWLNSEKSQLNSQISYTKNQFTFREFINDGNNYSGNDLTGVPSDVFNAIIDFETAFGLYGNLNYQQVGQIPITDSNSLYSKSYSLTNLKLGFKKAISGSLNFDLFFGLNNIFDTKYASQVLINATGFGGSAPRYYYPGNPVNYFTGIQLNYSF
ncbi:TonB-dependent receptor domain-containing protein [Gaetbulibacter aestuarii]|uniref:TonB-dependent receptor n=1 Tax=Gaetbulibacter aestuarii TaxID=1502358 RepID=A0ABW7MZY2_9FLAO